MKAVAVFPRTHEVKLIEQEAPRLTEPDQVRVRMLEMGICGTDKEICAFEYGTPPEGADYLVIGRPITGASDPAAAADSIAAEMEKALAPFLTQAQKS